MNSKRFRKKETQQPSRYGELLQDPRWQKKRLEILERDGWRCVICNNGAKTLHVHHRRYADAPWEVDDNDLHALCDKCHGLFHDVQREKTGQPMDHMPSDANLPSSPTFMLRHERARIAKAKQDLATMKPGPFAEIRKTLCQGIIEDAEAKIRKLEEQAPKVDADDEP